MKITIKNINTKFFYKPAILDTCQGENHMSQTDLFKMLTGAVTPSDFSFLDSVICNKCVHFVSNTVCV